MKEGVSNLRVIDDALRVREITRLKELIVLLARSEYELVTLHQQQTLIANCHYIWGKQDGNGQDERYSFDFLNYCDMKKFEEGLKEKAHLSKIKQAKTTLLASVKPQSKMGASKVGAEAHLLLELYDKKSYDSIPAYKLLRTAGLQQYTKGFIQRGFGINLGKLALIGEQDKRRLYEQLKILPGHTVKLDRIIDSLAKSSYSMQGNAEVDCKYSVEMPSKDPDRVKLKVLARKDVDYEKQLERVLNQYTPQNDPKKKTFISSRQSGQSDKKNPTTFLHTNEIKVKTKYSAPVKDRSVDFKKKPAQASTKSTIKKGLTSDSMKREPLARMLKSLEKTPSMSTKKVLEINLQIDKVKALNRSFDGALMTSTIANIDVEELVYAFSGLVASKIVIVSEPQTHFNSCEKEMQRDGGEQIEDEVGEILKESFLHPLYKEQVQEELVCEEDAYSQGEEDEEDKNTSIQNQFAQEPDKMMESSFLGGESVDFGVMQPLRIFDEPQPTAIDYFKPTIDSVSNFIKNIVLTAKMQREIPIMAAAYLQNFTAKTKLQLTSLNYKRLLVTVLLLASKIWDDQSFQTPSFSKTFPQYSTVLLNEMQKQVVKALDYKLKIDKKEYTKTFFRMRKHTKENIRSYQNRKLTLRRIRELQSGVRRDYKPHFLTKRNSY